MTQSLGIPEWAQAAEAPATLQVPLPSTIRVRIAHTRRGITLGGTGRYDYMSLRGGKVFSSDRDQKVRPGRGYITIGGRTFKGDVLVAPVQTHDFVRINGKRHRGAILLEGLKSGYMDVIEQVPMEEYLYGVLPREVGGDWPAESLKAQAVVSRSYVMANLSADPASRYDVSNDVSDQVYGGTEAEVPAASAAVEATRGQVLVDRYGKPVNTFFHSSCGGRTEKPEYVWQKPVDHSLYTSISDNFCRADPYSEWKMTITPASVKARLRKAGIRVGEIKNLKIVETSPSGRVWFFRVVGSARTVKIQGNKFRLALGPEKLRSTYITSLEKTRRGFVFEGRGWGHGVGVCQWGALGRSKAGQNYREILKAYYPETRLAIPGAR